MLLKPLLQYLRMPVSTRLTRPALKSIFRRSIHWPNDIGTTGKTSRNRKGRVEQAFYGRSSFPASEQVLRRKNGERFFKITEPDGSVIMRRYKPDGRGNIWCTEKRFTPGSQKHTMTSTFLPRHKVVLWQ